jgi:UDP-glucose 4-epimerase
MSATRPARRVLVTGGSGYIGSHVCRLLQARGDTPIVVDDVVTGLRERIDGVELHELDLAASGASVALETIMRSARIDAVIHFAARKQVGESVARPLWYAQQNIGGLHSVLSAMAAVGTRQLVFSSSAAVYGDARGMVDEEAPTQPVNPYGESKLAGEWLAADVARAHDLRAVSLRYFNVAGAGWPELADRAVLNLIPMALERMRAGLPPQIFGTDYPTPDGTCVRDFVHVLDVAEAHLVALDALTEQPQPHRAYNVGTGRGCSVSEVIDALREHVPDSPPPNAAPRRAGDPGIVVANVDRIANDWGWRASRDLTEIVRSAATGAASS